MPTTLVTGANRGLGLEFVRQYAADGWTVHACCRAPAKAAALSEVRRASQGRVTIHELDVRARASSRALAAALKGEAIDVLVNNAGVYGGDRQAFGRVDDGAWDATLRVNALGPLLVTEALAENVVAGKARVIACITSRMGSIGDNTSGGDYIYLASKAALNAVIVCLAHDLAGRGITVLAFHPGWVRTDMGGPNAPVTPEQSIAGMRALIARAGPADSGRFLDYSGRPVPW